MKKIILFTLLTLAGVAGIFPWQSTPQSVGYFKISKNPFGIAIYQDGLHNSVEFIDAKRFIISGKTISIYGSTSLTYGRDDIIFDDGAIYTDASQEDIDFLHKKKIDTTVLPNTMYLINPHVPGALELHGTNLRIDKNKKQITGEIKDIIVPDNI